MKKQEGEWNSGTENPRKDASKRRFDHFRGKFDQAKSAYAREREAMDRRERYYNGDRTILNANGRPSKRKASNIRNIIYELIETEVDSSVPVPRITPVHAEDREVARQLEALLRNELQRLRMDEMNDLQERVCPIHGGDLWLVEWDPTGGYHCNLGELVVQELHPKQVLPQPGVYDIDKMQYIFVMTSRSRKAVEQQFVVELKAESESEPDIRQNANSTEGVVEDLVTQVDCYYRNRKGGIGRISWVNDALLRDEEDYQARRETVCTKCGTVKSGDTCQICGGNSFREQDAEAFLVELNGQQVAVPYYKPNQFPLVMRKNISKYGSFLGVSDVDVLADQQEAIKKFGTKIDEKILKGGSYVTLPQDVNVETTDRELKVIRVKNPADKSMIGVINVQPDISKEQTQLEMNYQWAKSTIGVTDSFQGKYDASATSGTAKQFAANQSAGRLLSKRKMKYACYTRLYELMFHFLMAYADEPIPYQTTDENGEMFFAHFDPKNLLKVDASGQVYWNDEFLFGVDESATIASNRETLWNMADVKFQSGAFGPITDLRSAAILWTWLEATGYPQAGAVKRRIDEWLAAQNAASGAGAGRALPDGVDGRTSVQQADLTNLAALGIV